MNCYDNPNFFPKRINDYGSIEYTWSMDKKEKIAQFYYQCVRTDEEGVITLRKILTSILKDSYYEIDFAYLELLYRMIGSTRDIIMGKGERTLSYMMIDVWYDYYPIFATHALDTFVKSFNNQVPYGSWKDIKYFCDYCIKNGRDFYHPLITHSVKLINEQLKKDEENYLNNSKSISLVAKWIPRENSKFKWLFILLSSDYYSVYLNSSHDNKSYIKALTKCKCSYRQLISTLNKELSTPEVIMCNSEWKNIDFGKIGSCALAKNKNAFLGVSNTNTKQSDRISCTNNFVNFVENAKDIKGANIEMETFTNMALSIINQKENLSTSTHKEKMLQTDELLVNMMWKNKNNESHHHFSGNFIPIIDVSMHMQGAPIKVANALGISIAEKSELCKGVITYSSDAKWINLSEDSSFVSMTQKICMSQPALNSNLYSAIDLLVDTIISSRMDNDVLSNLTLVILSNMEIEEITRNKENITLYNYINHQFNEIGLKINNRPFDCPHIVFWNLKQTNGFPCLSLHKKVYMISGYSPNILNTFCDNISIPRYNEQKNTSCATSSTSSGTKHTQKIGENEKPNLNSWEKLEHILKNKRYDILGKKIITPMCE